MSPFLSRAAAALLASTMLLPGTVWADDTQKISLADQFRDPPASARPRVWWHWMNGNITKDGIAKDLAWMKRIGIGGAQTFDANLQTPQVVDKRLVYMTPEWKDAFRFAASEADRLGLELAIAASPGWSETGGPWVKPEDGLKKLVWTSAQVLPGQRPTTPLTALPTRSGPFQAIAPGKSIEELLSGQAGPTGPDHGGNVAVIAFPVPRTASLGQIVATDLAGNAVDTASLSDAKLSDGVTLARKEGQPLGLQLRFSAPVTVRSATLYLPNMALPFVGSLLAATLEASSDGVTWRKIDDLKLAAVPTTLSFPAVHASQFRLTLNPPPPAPSLGDPVPGLIMPPFSSMVGGLLATKPIVVGTFRLTAEPAVDRFETKAGFVMSPDYYALPQPADGATGIAPGSVIDLTGQLRPDGTLDWTAPRLPKGQVWQVLRLGYSLLGTTNHPAPPEATGLEVDKFDGAAVRAYLEHYIGMYRDATGAELVGKRGVKALLTDSIEVGEANWTPKMLEQFRRLRGYDALPWLPALTGTLVGTRAETDRFLYDYRRTLADLLASEHYGTVAKVAHENGLLVYGEALEDHRPMLGDDMAMRRHADVPMAALWTFNRADGPRQTLVADMKGAASVAHLYGQNLVAAESMTAAMAPWAFAPKDLKRFIDLEFATGVNRPVIHTSVHVPVNDKQPGLSLFIFGQYFNRNESWAELARPWVDYIARSSLLLQWGRNVADVAYFHGEEAPLTGLYGDKPVADAPTANAYDFLNFDALTEALRNDGPDVVSAGGARYRAIYLGGTSRMMTVAALAKLAALVEGGATVIGMAPQADPSRSGDPAQFAALVAKLWPGGPSTRVGKGRVIASQDVNRSLRSLGVGADFAFTGGTSGANIAFVHRQSGDEHIYFVVNQGTAPETIKAHFRVTGLKPELWHAETGKSEPVGYRMDGHLQPELWSAESGLNEAMEYRFAGSETEVPLTLVAGESVFVVFREATKDQRMVEPIRAELPLQTLDDDWALAFESGRGAPPTLALPRLMPLETSADPGVKYYSGVMRYARSFTLGKRRAKGPLWLDLGEVGDLAQVHVNGVDVGTAWHAPYRLDIAGAVKPGRNALEIRVANTWVNRLVGDAQPGAKPVTWTALPTYRADAPLRPTGLIGPVRLLEVSGAAISKR